MERFYCYNLNNSVTGEATLEQTGQGWVLRYAYGSPWAGGIVNDGQLHEELHSSRDNAITALKRLRFEVER